MDDIVARLRKEWAECETCVTGNEAAVVIERLRNQVRQLEAERDQWQTKAVSRD